MPSGLNAHGNRTVSRTAHVATWLPVCSAYNFSGSGDAYFVVQPDTYYFMKASAGT